MLFSGGSSGCGGGEVKDNDWPWRRVTAELGYEALGKELTRWKGPPGVVGEHWKLGGRDSG